MRDVEGEVRLSRLSQVKCSHVQRRQRPDVVAAHLAVSLVLLLGLTALAVDVGHLHGPRPQRVNCNEYTAGQDTRAAVRQTPDCGVRTTASSIDPTGDDPNRAVAGVGGGSWARADSDIEIDRAQWQAVFRAAGGRRPTMSVDRSSGHAVG